MRCSFGLLLLTLATPSVFAGSKVELEFIKPKEYAVYESSSWPMAEPKELVKVGGERASYTLKSDAILDRVFVIDLEAGNVATKQINEIRETKWVLSNDQFTVVYKVEVEVSRGGKPVDAANVELTDNQAKRNELIDPSSNGKATFYFVRPGDLKLSVNYKVNGKNAEPLRQVFTVKTERDTATPVLKVALPDDGTTASSTSGEGSKGSEPAKSESKGGNPLGNILTTILGLAFVGGVAYFIIRMLNQNPDKVKDTLTKLGADIPKPADDPVNDPDPVKPIVPEPVQQIILDSVPAVAPVTPSSPAVATGIPKLVSSDGSSFELPEGETVVGREFGNGLVVPNDTISRRHAVLTKTGQSVMISDQGSTNGTWINGAKLSVATELRNGDSVRFGSVEYRFEA